eukprot:scaffold20405_cov45-Attheya_sp.AAC.1
MSWKCLTEEFGMDPERLYASYFGGDESSPADLEARDIWLQFLPASRVLPFDAKDNFWEMGATGPCGPCVEIHYDRIGGGRDAAHLVNADVADVIEIWNNVFIQYNREADGSLRPLPSQHIDTGMGFERLTSILQNVDSNYDTDIFIPLFSAIQAETGAPPYSGKVGQEDAPLYQDMAYRVVADHIRTLCFAIADGAMPSNTDRGYVLRRVLRRAVRYGRQNLGAQLGFFSKLVPTLVDLMGSAFPELKEQQAHVTAVIQEEEESFSKTLDKGLLKFNELALASSNPKVFKGEDAHFLYTSMGFPVDLTELMAEERGMVLDRDGFEAKMKHEQELSGQALLTKRMAGAGGKDMRLVAEQTSYLAQHNVMQTDDSAKYIWNEPLVACQTMGLFIGRNETQDKLGFVSQLLSDDTQGTVGVILDKTSFYAESGGQTYDTGTLTSADGTFILQVDSVQIYGPFCLHTGRVIQGTLSLGDALTCNVDYERRSPIAANHTMTHVLNYALKEVLVKQADAAAAGGVEQSVDQRGSLVDENKLRFDFSWNGPLTEQQLGAVEQICINHIENAVPVQSYVAPLADAQQISSLRAVFGETYPDPVRVISVSPEPIPTILENPQDPTWDRYSIEFCGGTHLQNVSEAQGFCLLSEDGIAKGIRRIIGVTQADAKIANETAATFEGKLIEGEALEGVALEEQVKLLTTELNGLSISASKKMSFRGRLGDASKRVVVWKKQMVASRTADILEQCLAAAAATEGTKVVVRADFGVDGKIAKSVTAAFGKKIKDKALMILTADVDADKFMVVACAPKSLKDVDCKAWVVASTEGTNGKGGGKKDTAQFTIPGVSHMDAVMEKAKTF